MISLLFNKINFDEDWAKEDLGNVFSSGQKVAILPLMVNEGWSYDESYWDDNIANEDNKYEYIRPFLSYGIKKKDISILDPYNHSLNSTNINNYDVLMLVASSGRQALYAIQDSGLDYALDSFKGILVGIDGGALVLTQEIEDDEEGLSILEGFLLFHNYNQEEHQLQRIIHLLEVKESDVLILPDKGGILIDGYNAELLGNAFVANSQDLDELYLMVK